MLTGNKQGSTALVLVISLLGIAFAGAVAQFGAARHLCGQTASGLAGAQALRTAQALLDDAAATLARAAGSPAHPHYTELRRRVATATASADLSDLVPAEQVTGVLAWKRASHATQQPVGTVTADPVRATALAFRALAEDERTGSIELTARVSVTLAGTTVTRTLTERRELKLVIAGPPRPFDQTALVVEDLSALTDAAKANAQRAQLLTILDETIAKIQSVHGSLSPDVAKTLAEIQAGAPRPDQRERLMPKLPSERCGAVGLSQTGSVGFAWLDLASRLEEDVRELAGLHDRVMSAAGRASQDGGKEMLERVIASLTVYNRASTRIWEYQRLLKVWTASNPDYQQVFGHYGPRLSAPWYASRNVLTLDPAHPLYADWSAGRRELTGVFETKSSTDLRLEGPRGGRTVLVVDAPAVELANVTAAKPGDLLTVVIARGRVRLSGRVDAYLIVDGQAKIEMAPDTQLTGGLALRAGAALKLAGKLSWSAGTVAGRTTAESLAQGGRGPYGLAFSPVPVSIVGGRQ